MNILLSVLASSADDAIWWTKFGAVGGWAAATATLLAVCFSMVQNWRLNRSHVQSAEKETRQRRLYLFGAVLTELKENQVLSIGQGWSLAQLHRSAWEAARPELHAIPEALAHILLEAYHSCSRANDLLAACHATGKLERLDSEETTKIHEDVRQKLTSAEQQLSRYLDEEKRKIP